MPDHYTHPSRDNRSISVSNLLYARLGRIGFKPGWINRKPHLGTEKPRYLVTTLPKRHAKRGYLLIDRL